MISRRPLQRHSYFTCGLVGRYLSSSSSSSTTPTVLPPPQPVVELRDDVLFPQHASTYHDILASYASLSNNATTPAHLRFVSTPLVGGDLHTVTHALYYEGGLRQWQDETTMNKKQPTMTNLGISSMVDHWQETELLSCLQSQRSTVFVEAPLVKEYSDLDLVPGLANATNLHALTHNDDPNQNDNGDGDDDDGEKHDCILELRHYHLKLGYDTVPNFLQLYGAGLPSKLEAPGTDPGTKLVTLLYSEVGRLNQVVEIWRHGHGVEGMERSRVAARGAIEWRTAVAQLADLALEFRSTVHRPLRAVGDCLLPLR